MACLVSDLNNSRLGSPTIELVDHIYTLVSYFEIALLFILNNTG